MVLVVATRASTSSDTWEEEEGGWASEVWGWGAVVRWDSCLAAFLRSALDGAGRSTVTCTSFHVMAMGVRLLANASAAERVRMSFAAVGSSEGACRESASACLACQAVDGWSMEGRDEGREGEALEGEESARLDVEEVCWRCRASCICTTVTGPTPVVAAVASVSGSMAEDMAGVRTERGGGQEGREGKGRKRESERREQQQWTKQAREERRQLERRMDCERKA